MTPATPAARDITETDVRQSISTTITHLERAAEQVVWQVQNKVWIIIGYASWDEMREAEYRGAAVIVPRADRPELVARLAQEGLSQKQIGDTLGVSQRQVSTDIRSSANTGADLPPTRTDALGRERPTSYQRQPSPADTDDVPFPQLSSPPGDPSANHDSRASSEAVQGYLDANPDVQAQKLRAAAWRALTSIHSLAELHAENVAATVDDDFITTLGDTLDRLDRWARTVRAARHPAGLRIIGGRQ